MKEDNLENEMTAEEFLKRRLPGFESRTYEDTPDRYYSIISCVREYATLKTSHLQEQLEKLQEENKLLQESEDELCEKVKKLQDETVKIHNRFESSQEETSLLKSQLENLQRNYELEVLIKKSCLASIEKADQCMTNQHRQLEEKDREIEALKELHERKDRIYHEQKGEIERLKAKLDGFNRGVAVDGYTCIICRGSKIYRLYNEFTCRSCGYDWKEDHGPHTGTATTGPTKI